MGSKRTVKWSTKHVKISTTMETEVKYGWKWHLLFINLRFSMFGERESEIVLPCNRFNKCFVKVVMSICFINRDFCMIFDLFLAIAELFLVKRADDTGDREDVVN